MFKVHLDESGIHKGSKIVTVAGVAMTLLRLGLFDRKWSRIIKNAGVSEFKAKDFLYLDRRGRRGGEFHNWTKNQAYDFLHALLGVLRSVEPVRVGAAMVVDDFNALEEKARRYLTGATYNPWTDKLRTSGAPKTPFHVPMQLTLMLAASKRPAREKYAHFVCDEQDQFAGYVVQRFREIKRRHPTFGFGDIVHSESRKVPGLQAADLLCYVLTRQAHSRLKTGTMDPCPLMEEVAGTRFRFEYLDRAFLETELLTGLRQVDQCDITRNSRLSIARCGS